MRLQSKDQLTPAEHEAVKARLADVHALEWQAANMPSAWARFPASRLFAMFEGDMLAGLAAIDGGNEAIDPGWWIEGTLQGQRYGSRLVELLASRLVEDGITGVKQGVTVIGPYPERSAALVRKLRELIAKKRAFP
jgi:hypothetical protein